MKALLIKWLLPITVDYLIVALSKLVLQSSNTIDDKLVETVKVNRQEIIDEIKRQL